MTQPSAVPIHRDVPSFDVVDAVTPVGTAPCAECRGPIVDTYFESDAGVICAACHTRIATELASRATPDGFLRALAFGAGAAIAGAAIYFTILALTAREMSVVALLVGLLVGKAVRLGAGRRGGGRRYQWLAVALTYVAIASTYLPFVLKGITGGAAAPTAEAMTPATANGAFLSAGTSPVLVATPRQSLGVTAVDAGALVLLAMAAPVLEGANHPLTLATFLLAVAMAWRLNRPAELRMAGPFHVRAARV